MSRIKSAFSGSRKFTEYKMATTSLIRIRKKIVIHLGDNETEEN